MTSDGYADWKSLSLVLHPRIDLVKVLSNGHKNPRPVSTLIHQPVEAGIKLSCFGVFCQNYPGSDIRSRIPLVIGHHGKSPYVDILLTDGLIHDGAI